MAAHRHHGVVPICRTLQVAPSAVRWAMSRPVCARRLADDAVKPLPLEVFNANYRVYGRRERKAALRREHGINMDKDRIARLMRELDIRGVTRSKTTVTTRSDRNSPRRGSSPVQCSRCAAPSEGGIPVSVIRFEIVLGKGGVLHRTGIPSDPSARTAWPPN